MARYTGPVCRLCRREGQKLHLKGDKCFSKACALETRSYAPGQHGQARKKLSEYGLQLREKQKVRRYYGLTEKPMLKYFLLADKMPGRTGENLLKVLESRLDNVVCRAGLASSRSEARQLIVHGHFLVNGKKVDIPSYLTNVGDVIEVKEKSKKSEKFAAIKDNHQASAPAWISVDSENLKANVVAEVSREDIDLPVEEHLIVELYSKNK